MSKQELDKVLDRYEDAPDGEEQRKRLYMRVFNTEDGQLVRRDIARRSWTETPIFAEDWNTHRAAFKDGARSVLLHVDTMLEPIEAKTETNHEGATNG